MYSPLFTIKKKPVKNRGIYTHDIYFKGILLSEDGYYEEDTFHMDGCDEVDIEDFFSFKITELPPWLLLSIRNHYIYKEFLLGLLDLKNGKVNFDIQIHESDFIFSPGKFSSLKDAALAVAEELYGADAAIQDDENMAYWVIPMVYQKEETLEDVYRRAKKEVIKFYKIMSLNLNSRMN